MTRTLGLMLMSLDILLSENNQLKNPHIRWILINDKDAIEMGDAVHTNDFLATITWVLIVAGAVLSIVGYVRLLLSVLAEWGWAVLQYIGSLRLGSRICRRSTCIGR